MSFKGVIFDLDGTLVDSLEDLADSMNTVLQKHGFPTHDLQAYRYFVGNGLKNLVSKAIPEVVRTDELTGKCYKSMMEIYGSNCINKTRPYPEVAELLNQLSARKLKLAVFTNKNDDLAKRVVAALLPNVKFEAILGFTADIPRKPNPQGAFVLSRKLGISPEDIIYVGDSEVDMQTANSAGMNAAGALWGFRTRDELIENGATFLLERPMDLIQVLK